MSEINEELLCCPFCGKKPDSFGRGLDEFKNIVEQVIHPMVDNPRCPLNSLVFKVDAWNRRVS